MITAPVMPTADARRPSGVRDYISPSRLTLWLKCPLAFKIRYVDGVITPTSPAAFVGKVVHAALETYYRHRQLGLTIPVDTLLRQLIDRWEESAAEEGVGFSSVAAEATCRRQATELVALYITQLPADEPRPLAVEVTLATPLADPVTGEHLGIPLLGIMDLVLPHADGPEIVDFKTAARCSTTLEIVHEIQLSSYAYLFRRTTGQHESALEIRSLIKTKVPKIESSRFPSRSAAHFRRLFAVIRGYLDDLDSGKFVFRPGLGCDYCQVRSQCKAWQA